MIQPDLWDRLKSWLEMTSSSTRYCLFVRRCAVSKVKHYAKRGLDEPCCDSTSDMILHHPCGEVSECEACGATFTYDFNYPTEGTESSK